MLKSLIIVISIFGGFYLYGDYKSGNCGFGYFNNLPYGLNMAYINRYSLNDADGWGVIYPGYAATSINDNDFIIEKISQISYDQNSFYALINSQDNQSYYAVINQPDPVNNMVQYMSKQDFLALNAAPLNWVSINSTYCAAGRYMAYAPYYFYALMALLTAIFSIALMTKYKDR